MFKVENAWATNYMSYREVTSNDTEERWKIWREIDLPFQIWHKEFDEFWLLNCTQDWYKIWIKTGLCFQKLTWAIWQIFTTALESLQIGTLMEYFYLRLKIYEFKNFRWVVCHHNDEWCQIWRGADLSVQNWNEAFDEFWPEHSKTS